MLEFGVGKQGKSSIGKSLYSTTVHFNEIVAPSFLGLIVSAPVRRSKDA